MLCNVCGCSDFLPAEYKSEIARAPALECARCHALVLDEGAAATEEERESVKLAKAIRAEIIAGGPPPPRKS